MRIAYKKRHLNINLIMGIVWCVWFFILIFTGEETKWTDYGWSFISMFYLGTYFYQRHYKYLNIENGTIKICSPFGKQMRLDQIKRIKKFAGDYILKGEDKELTINTNIIDPNSKTDLDSELQLLNVEWV